MGLRRTLRWAWIYFLYGTGLLAWARRRVHKKYQGIIVLTLHRVLNEADRVRTNSPSGMILSSKSFEDLIAHLSNNYEVVALNGQSFARNGSAAKPRFAVTFDDGWQDTAAVAAPIAKQHAVPVTIFVCPGLVGRSIPFWPEKIKNAWKATQEYAATAREFSELTARICVNGQQLKAVSAEAELDELIGHLKNLPDTELAVFIEQVSKLELKCHSRSVPTHVDETMGWQEAIRIAETGVQIGSHTQNHKILPKLPLQDVRRELNDSKLAIEKELGRECLMFAYPNGSWSEDVRALVVQAGYKQAFSNETGVWSLDSDPWVIPRVNIWDGSVIGPSGRFSPVVFQYATFWCGINAVIRNRTRENKRAIQG